MGKSLVSCFFLRHSVYTDAGIIIAGDFNQLNTSFLDVDHGLVRMV